MLFGNPVKYWDLTPYMRQKREAAVFTDSNEYLGIKEYDLAVENTTDFFRQTQMYNFFTNNCHSYVACVMEAVGIGKYWNMAKLTLYMMIFGRYISFGRFLKAHLPFLILVALVAVLGKAL